MAVGTVGQKMGRAWGEDFENGGQRRPGRMDSGWTKTRGQGGASRTESQGSGHGRRLESGFSAAWAIATKAIRQTPGPGVAASFGGMFGGIS